jgi:hypothetical protein
MHPCVDDLERLMTARCPSDARRLIFRLAVGALLLFAQQVAIGHQLKHGLDHAPFQSQRTGDPGNFHSDLCGFHSDFESLLSAVDSTPPPLFVTGTVFERLSAPVPRFYATEPVIPASRGPPSASSLIA